jgi:hypothetical protein
MNTTGEFEIDGKHMRGYTHPQARAEARVSIDGVQRSYRSRRATPDEDDRYWREAVAFWPGYDDYRERARREIWVFVLEPAGE